MKVYIKIYKFCDADFYAINGSGISVASLIKLALMYRAAGRELHIFIPGCLPYDVSGKHRCVPLEITVTDPASIRFLKKEIKPRARTAFLKAILRQALMDQMTGVFLKEASSISKENIRISAKDLDSIDDLLILRPGEFRRNYLPFVQRRTVFFEKENEEEEEEVKKPGRKRLGDVEDLAPDLEAAKKEKPADKEKVLPAKEEDEDSSSDYDFDDDDTDNDDPGVQDEEDEENEDVGDEDDDMLNLFGRFESL